MTINSINQIASKSSGANPNYYQMLQDLGLLKTDNQLLAQYLSQVPPPSAAIRALLLFMQGLAQKINSCANGDTAFTPGINDMIATIDNALVLINQKNPDFAGISTLMENGILTAQIQNLIYFCTFPGTVPTPQPANKQDMEVQLALLQSYLAEYKYDISHGDYNDADRIYGYVMTAASNLFNDGSADPAIAPVLGALLGSISNIRSMFLSDPPDYKGILELLNSGALENSITAIVKFLSSVYCRQ